MATTTRVVMPQLGESVHEGTIARWLVKPGDRVVEFEPMLEVDTDKVSAEVPAPVSGVLREILAQEGQTVQAGTEIAVVELGGDGQAGGPGHAAPPAPAAAARPPATAAPVEKPVAGASPAPPSPELPSGEHRYSPAVQMLAAELKVDLARVTGTGLGGRITKKDVQDHAAKPQAQPSTVAQAEPVRPAEGDEVVQLTRVRRLIAENMTRSKSTIPHAWQTQEVDMSGVVANRALNKSGFQRQEGFSLTYLPYVLAATVSALREHREVNATFNAT